MLLLILFVLLVVSPVIASVGVLKLQLLLLSRLNSVGLLIMTVIEIGLAYLILSDIWVRANDVTPFYLEEDYYDGSDRFWTAVYFSIVLPLICLCNIVTAIAMVWN